MAFASSKTQDTVFGNMRCTMGTFTNAAGDAGGNINTGLHQCLMITLGHYGSATEGTSLAINETFPCDGSAVTIATNYGLDGYWIAYGY